MRYSPYVTRAAVSWMKRWLLKRNTACTGASCILHLILVIWCVGVGGASATRHSSDVYEVDIVTDPARIAQVSDASRETIDAREEREGDEKSLSGVEKEEALPALSPAPAPELVKQVSERTGGPEPQAHPSREHGMVSARAQRIISHDSPETQQGESSSLAALWKSRVRGVLDMAWKNTAEKANADLSLKTTYLLRVSREGELLDKRLLVSSGNAAFDLAVQLALESARRFPRPPEALLAGRESVEFPMSFAPSE